MMIVSGKKDAPDLNTNILILTGSAMIKTVSKISNNSFYLPLTTALFTVLSFFAAASSGGSVKKELKIKKGAEKKLTVNITDVFNGVHEQRIKFAANHGVADPAGLVASVKDSTMANLLISVAIEESRGDPVAVGSSGEQGAWQVKASDWGSVPRDLYGQAGQAERIIAGLMIHAKGNKKKALAHYNGGTIPSGRSYRYAERILERASNLQFAVNHLPQNYKVLRQVLLVPPSNSGMLAPQYTKGS